MEQGLPPPDLGEADAADDLDLPDEDWCSELWQELDRTWWTSWPPPAGFDGVEHGLHGDPGYRRMLSEAEERVAVAEFEDGEEAEAARAAEIAERDAFFGFEGGWPDDWPEPGGGGGEEEVFSPMEAEPYETSDPPPAGEGDHAQHGGGGGAGTDAGAAEPGGERNAAAPDGAAPAAAAELYEPSWLRSRSRADAGVPLSPE